MTDNKEEAKATEEVKEEVKEIKLSEFSDIFVTENDTFDVSVKYYKKEDSIIVENVDDVFDPEEECNEFSVTLKYPDQGDSAKISGQVSTLRGAEEIDVREFLNLEVSRLLILIREWSIDEKLNNAKVMKMHPKIIKSLVGQIRNKIGMDGII